MEQEKVSVENESKVDMLKDIPTNTIPKVEIIKEKTFDEKAKEIIAAKLDNNKSPIDSHDFKVASVALMNKALALNKLPSAKYLVQHIDSAPDLDIVDSFVNGICDDVEWITAGQGAEYILTQYGVVNTQDDSKFVPDTINSLEAQSLVDKIDIPKPIKETKLTIQEPRYIEYFLSGKLSEYASKIRDTLAITIKNYQNYGVLTTLKTIVQTLMAVAPSTDATPTNHLVGDSTISLIDALAEMKSFNWEALSPNTRFAYDPTFGGYNNVKWNDMVMIGDIETINNIKKYKTTFMSNEQFKEYFNVDNVFIVPTTVLNPNTNTIEKVNLFTKADGTYVKGCLLMLDKKSFKRLKNFGNVYSEFYPNNTAVEVWDKVRFSQGYLAWGNCSLYENGAFVKPFSLPVNTTTNIVESRKGKR